MGANSLIAGAVTSTGATVGAEPGPSHSCRLVYSTHSDLSSPTYSTAASSDTDGWVKIAVTGLTPVTQYYYGLEVDGVLDSLRGQFKTFPVEDVAASFIIGHASCADTGSTHRVFDAIKARNLDAFMHLGDWHYDSITASNRLLFQSGLRAGLRATRQGDLWRSLPVAYIYDDHDCAGGDNGDGTAVAKDTCAQVYRQVVPHYPLAGSGAAYQAFTIGRVRFIFTDLRYNRSPDTDTDNASKTMLGATQKAWLKSELLAHKDRPLTVWLNTQVWFMPSSGWSGVDTDGDHWGAFSTERAEISDYMAANAISNVTILAGDMHALGYKDRIDYSTIQGAPVRVLQAAAMDSTPLTRGSGWNAVSQGRGQYATLQVIDSGGANITVNWNGYTVDGTTGVETLTMSYSFVAGPIPGTHPVKTWDGATWVRRPVKTWDGAAWSSRPTKT